MKSWAEFKNDDECFEKGNNSITTIIVQISTVQPETQETVEALCIVTGFAAFMSVASSLLKLTKINVLWFDKF